MPALPHDGHAADRPTGAATGDGHVGEDAAGDGAPTGDGAVDGVAVALAAAVSSVVDAPVDGLPDETLETRLGEVERSIRRLTATRSLYAAELTRRRATAAADAHPDDPRASQRACRDVRRELADRLKLTPSDTKRTVRTGRALETLPRARQAFEDGDLSDRHLDQLIKTVNHFTGDQRADLEALLVDHGRQLDAVAFGRLCRRQLAIRDTDAAQRDLDRLKARRSARLTTSPDGATHLSVQSAGIDGELVHTAIHAFRRPDPSGHPPRTPEQATHDALIEALRAALDHGQPATQHGVKPHLLLITQTPEPGGAARDDGAAALMDGTADIAAGTGVVDTMWTGPLPASEIRWLVDDCRLTGLLADADGTPTAVTEQVRTVPVGLYKLLLVRDRGCVWPGCDTPAGWCDVAHGHTRYRNRGRLTPDSAALLCRRHHRIFDHRNYTIQVLDGTAQIHTDDGQPLDGHGRPPPSRSSRLDPANATAPAANAGGGAEAASNPAASCDPASTGTGTSGSSNDRAGPGQPDLLSETRASYHATGPPQQRPGPPIERDDRRQTRRRSRTPTRQRPP